MEELNTRALTLGVPLSVHLDLTWRCNERCVHCYLDHDGRGEMTAAEIDALLPQLTEAGVFFLTLSGGEPLLRKDLFDILRHARELTLNVKVKTNAILIREREAALMRDLGVDNVQVSIYSHREEVHDAITKARGSLARSTRAIRLLVSEGLKVTIAH
jgi:MoaA/NifB/PqqE/SkfB family radical SAM enzyme